MTGFPAQVMVGTTTYDKVEKDIKNTVETQLSLIGGTMGLLTGFSLLSGVEIIYFLCKFFLSLRITKPRGSQSDQITV